MVAEVNVVGQIEGEQHHAAGVLVAHVMHVVVDVLLAPDVLGGLDLVLLPVALVLEEIGHRHEYDGRDDPAGVQLRLDVEPDEVRCVEVRDQLLIPV